LDIKSHENKNNLKKYSFSAYLICFIFLYALFALNRIKKTLSFSVEGVTVTNEIWIVVLICFLLSINRRRKQLLYKYNFYLGICLFLYILVVIMGGFNIDSISQYIYSVFIFITPILLYFKISNFSNDDIIFLFKIIIIMCLIYAIFAIVLTKNYAFFMGLLGNPIDNYRYYSQYRPSMMLGSSITVSYYFNLTLPICFYIFYKSKKKKWRIISASTIAINLLATFVLLSRAASLCSIFIILYNIFFIKNNENKYSGKIILFILFVIAGIYSFQNYDLSRLTIGFDASSSSVYERLMASSLGLYIFSKNPIIGSGMGRFFKRVYENRYIVVDGFSGLIDPHNMYVLVLSETGLIGFILIIMIFLILFKSFSNIQEKMLRQTAYLTLFAFLFDAMGGSHLFNEISYSIIFWIYMGLFNRISIKDRIKVVNLKEEK